jgi:hypothetical protein
MLGVLEHLLGGPALDDLAEVHHVHPVTDLPDDAHVVADQQHRQVELLLEVLHQREDLRLDGDVQRRDGLVGHDEIGVDRQRPRQGDPLFLPPGELVGVAVGVLGREADPFEEVLDDGSPAVPVAHPVDLQRLAHGVADAHPRVEARFGVLEDHLGAPPEPLELGLVVAGDVLAVEPDDAAGRLLDPQEARRGRRLPTARLADQPDRLAALDVEVDAVHGADARDLPFQDPLRDRVVFRQSLDLDETHRRSPPGAAGSPPDGGSSPDAPPSVRVSAPSAPPMARSRAC